MKATSNTSVGDFYITRAMDTHGSSNDYTRIIYEREFLHIIIVPLLCSSGMQTKKITEGKNIKALWTTLYNISTQLLFFSPAFG
jgi:hypothetical protein